MSAETVHLFVCDTMLEWEPGYALTGVNDPTWQKQPGRYQVRTVGFEREPVRSATGLTVMPDLAIDEIGPGSSAMLILPGSELWQQEGGPAPRAVEKAAELLAGGTPVAAICGATFGLANGGLLDNRPHTSNALGYLKLAPGYHGDGFYQEDRAVTDGDLITAGTHSPMDFAYHILKRLDVFTPEVLDAWRDVYTEGGMATYGRLLTAHGAAPIG